MSEHVDEQQQHLVRKPLQYLLTTIIQAIVIHLARMFGGGVCV
jgi:hypothetical protein